MHKLLALENPIFQFLEKVFNLMLANLLLMVCSIPIITFGASFTGMLQVVQDQIFDEDQPVIRRFFYAFRENFKQATAAWLVFLIFLAGMGCNILLIIIYLDGWIAQFLKIIVSMLVVLALCIMSYLFALMTRYHNTIRQHLNNSLILIVAKLPRTIVMVILNTSIFWIPFFSMQLFFKTIMFWIMIGFACISYFNMYLLFPVFCQMEKECIITQPKSN